MAKKRCVRKKRTSRGMRCAKYSGTTTRKRKRAKRKTGRKRGRGTALGRAAKACRGLKIRQFRACMRRKLKK